MIKLDSTQILMGIIDEMPKIKYLPQFVQHIFVSVTKIMKSVGDI